MRGLAPFTTALLLGWAAVLVAGASCGIELSVAPDPHGSADGDVGTGLDGRAGDSSPDGAVRPRAWRTSRETLSTAARAVTRAGRAFARPGSARRSRWGPRMGSARRHTSRSRVTASGLYRVRL